MSSSQISCTAPLLTLLSLPWFLFLQTDPCSDSRVASSGALERQSVSKNLGVRLQPINNLTYLLCGKFYNHAYVHLMVQSFKNSFESLTFLTICTSFRYSCWFEICIWKTLLHNALKQAESQIDRFWAWAIYL